MRALILLPAFNEAGITGSVLDAIVEQHPRLPVLAVDDGSTDGRAAEVEKRKVRMLAHPFNPGYGAALQTGFTHALKEGFECVVQVDADGRHEPRSLGDLVAALQGGGISPLLALSTLVLPENALLEDRNEEGKGPLEKGGKGGSGGIRTCRKGSPPGSAAPRAAS